MSKRQLGTGVVIGRGLNLDFSGQPWLLRAGINLTYLPPGLGITLFARQLPGISHNQTTENGLNHVS